MEDTRYIMQYQLPSKRWHDCLNFTAEEAEQPDLFPPNVQQWMDELTRVTGKLYRMITRRTVVIEDVLITGRNNA